MAAKLDRVPREKVFQRALQLATEAMDLLDAHATEPEAAAYIALAQERLRTALTRD